MNTPGDFTLWGTVMGAAVILAMVVGFRKLGETAVNRGGQPHPAMQISQPAYQPPVDLNHLRPRF